MKVGGPSQLDPFSQLLFVLYTLRTGVTLYHSAYDFGISTATATRYFVTWVLLLKERLLKIFVRLTSEQIQKTTPPKFQQQYPGQDVKEIWDATEMQVQVPTDLNAQHLTYSDYKSRNTVKFLVGIAPAGFLTFISGEYLGQISDVELVKVCGILRLLEAGDYIMADKGFLVRAILNKSDLIMPREEGAQPA